VGIVGTLYPAEVDVIIGGATYTIPALPAAEWLEAIASPEGGAIVPGLLPAEDQREIWRLLRRGELEIDDLNTVWRDVLTAVTGQTWWMAAKLLTAVADPDTWPIVHGRLVKSGLDFSACSIGTALNAIYALAMDGCADEQARTQLQFDLNTPPAEVSPEEVFDAVDEGADWVAAMGLFQQMGGGSNAG
jgi:hypothetical protein